jgi:serine/threonine-protein kinase
VDLKERIRRSAPFSLTTAVDVGTAICDVLDFAHRRGFIHGDLRPGNILVTPEGQIKLTDFWVSNAVASSQSVRTNAMMRSVHYMAPEVAEGKPPTPVSDVYSLGVILFELLAGNLPFDGDTPIAIALRHARDPVPSLRALNPGVPKALEAAVVKALQKPPDSRFRSAKAMLNELKSVRDGLNLARPITWSQPAEKKAPEPPQEPDEEMGDLEYAEPVILSALRKTLLAVVLVIAIAVAIMFGYVLKKPADVKLPDLVGKTLEQAEATAGDMNFELAVRSEQFHEEAPAGSIYYMHPPAGRVIKTGKTVDVWVSKGSKYAKTPKVEGVSLEDAKKLILDAGLNVGEVSQEYNREVPAGNILKQSPEPGTRQERNQSVTLVFSLGPEPEEVPITPEEYENDTDETPQVRTFDVKFTVPKGKKDCTVRIVVLDDYGETVAYSDVASPGDRIEQPVDGVGDKVTIRIYIDDKLVREERKWK